MVFEIYSLLTRINFFTFSKVVGNYNVQNGDYSVLQYTVYVTWPQNKVSLQKAVRENRVLHTQCDPKVLGLIF